MKTVIEMACEAGFEQVNQKVMEWSCFDDEIERFAELVRADERAKIAGQPAPVQQEPVAFLVDGDLYYPEEVDWETLQEQGHTVVPLYTSPPAQRTWVGLTNEEIWLEYQARWPFHPAEEPTLAKDIAKFARAIEAAHGIKERT